MTASFFNRQQFQLHQSKRILLIEDNDVNRILLDDYLNYWGYDVQSLSEASTFFSTIEQFQPELILLDLKLPDIDGYTLLEKMHKLPDYVNIPVIVVSAFAFKADQQRALDLGACRYFVKPVNLIDLIQAIEEELALNSK
ncbi:response regulator receiver protein [Tolypothrix sp. NIES-4075]|uniref:response regulator n=1 Tax=Tolypothrix sp. NIES-4075 TaxID=2005459 RepID=UPI000B5CD136|nr:response regulator [Tolypothrix sp. NIES-4075]GAX39907.1 response regulator receiver protein [Tolypothrix sp. NIES-4075]